MKNIQVYYSVKYGRFEGKIDGKVVSRAKSIERVEKTVQAIVTRGKCNKARGTGAVVSRKPKFVIDTAVRNRVIEQTKIESVTAERMFGVSLSGLSISFFNRGSRGGFARYSSFEVGFNEVLAKENPEQFVNTIKHEIAHHIVRKLYYGAVQHHGKEFKKVFLALGGNGQTYHSMDVSNCVQKRTKVRAVYECNSCGREYKISKRVHTKIQAGNTEGYKCHCDGKINFKTILEIK